MDNIKQETRINGNIARRFIVFLCLALFLTLSIICYLIIQLKDSYKVKLDALEIKKISNDYMTSEDEVIRKYIYYQDWADVRSDLKDSLSNQEIIDFIKKGGTVKEYTTALCSVKNSENSLRKVLSTDGNRSYDAYFTSVMGEDGCTVRKRKVNSNCEIIDFFALTKGMTKEETIVALNCELPDIWTGSPNFPESDAHYILGENSSIIIKYAYNENGIYEINKVLYCEGESESALIQ